MRHTLTGLALILAALAVGTTMAVTGRMSEDLSIVLFFVFAAGAVGMGMGVRVRCRATPIVHTLAGLALILAVLGAATTLAVLERGGLDSWLGLTAVFAAGAVSMYVGR